MIHPATNSAVQYIAINTTPGRQIVKKPQSLVPATANRAPIPQLSTSKFMTPRRRHPMTENALLGISLGPPLEAAPSLLPISVSVVGPHSLAIYCTYERGSQRRLCRGVCRGAMQGCGGARGALREEMEMEEGEEGGVCQCVDRRGETVEDAFEISDDDEVEIVAVKLRPVLATPAVDYTRAEVIAGAHLTADDIAGHQKNHKRGILADGCEDVVVEEEVETERESVNFVEEGRCVAKALEEARCVAKALEEEARSVAKAVEEARCVAKALKEAGNVPVGVKAADQEFGSGKRARGKERNVDEDDLEECVFGSPRHKKTREVRRPDFDDDDEPDFEVAGESDSERELSPEVEDPYDDIWREVAVMARQSKVQEEEGEGEGEGRCVHEFQTRIDVGRACGLCGFIKDDIKDLTFGWRKPCAVRRQSNGRGLGVKGRDGDGDGVLEEEARLVGMPPLEAHTSLEGAMHPHQVEGFKFLSRNLVEEDSGGCMLAFAPGTGKSFLMISFIHSFMLQVPNARPMIVAPKSMLRPWTQEFKKWQVEETTVLNLYEAGDDGAKVEMLKQWQGTRSVLLVGYAQCTTMSGEIGRYLIEGPGLMVLDEGHLARTETTKILKSLSRVHTKRRVLLSGTPFNNNLQEFYTTLELVRPNFMRRASAEMEPTLNALMPPEPKPSERVSPLPKRSSNAGRQAFKDAIGENLFESGQHESITRALGQLRRLIEPFVAWHKGQILETLPGITDLTVMLEMTSIQRELLNKENSEVRDSLQKRAAAIYVHPILEPVSGGAKRSQKDPRLRGENIDLKQGAKLRWVLDLVQLCEAAKEKVLIFSEYLYALELIENLAMRRMKWSKGSQILRIDGKMDTPERETVINKFNNDPEARMLCASIKACGEGVSLVGASRVVLLEVVWNPSVTRQAISRAFRIGQQKKVVVYRLIAADTLEEHRIHATATRKEWLSKLLFDPSISCVDPNSILWDVTNNCRDMFLKHGPLRNGVKSIYEREF